MSRTKRYCLKTTDHSAINRALLDLDRRRGQIIVVGATSEGRSFVKIIPLPKGKRDARIHS